MRKTIAKALILAVSVSMAVPPAQAARMGSGRSAGRQSQMARPAPPSSARPASPYNAPYNSPRQAPGPYAPATPYGNAPVQQPGMARQNLPPNYPQTPPARQQGGAGSMLGGALLGFGLGSLFSRSNQPTVTTNSDGTMAEQPVRQGGGGWLWMILIAAVVFFVIRRMRR